MAERRERERKGGLTEAAERISVELACRIARISRTDTGEGECVTVPSKRINDFFLLLLLFDLSLFLEE